MLLQVASHKNHSIHLSTTKVILILTNICDFYLSEKRETDRILESP